MLSPNPSSPEHSREPRRRESDAESSLAGPESGRFCCPKQVIFGPFFLGSFKSSKYEVIEFLAPGKSFYLFFRTARRLRWDNKFDLMIATTWVSTNWDFYHLWPKIGSLNCERLGLSWQLRCNLRAHLDAVRCATRSRSEEVGVSRFFGTSSRWEWNKIIF